jgi:dihydrofolate reductase
LSQLVDRYRADANFHAPGIEVTNSLENALALCADENPFVIGGASLYAEALKLAERLYVTEIEAELVGDTFFPLIDSSVWQEESREVRTKDEKNIYELQFVVLTRR